MAFTFGNRATGRSIRLVLKPEVLTAPDEELSLGDLLRSGQASADEIKRYEEISESRIRDLFSAGPGNFFEVQELTGPLPPAATIAQSLACDSCGEMVMKTKLEDLNGRSVCKGCTAADG